MMRRSEQHRLLLICGGAGWHQSGGKLTLPDNVVMLPLPPYSPELNPMENGWDYLRANKLSTGIWDSYDDILIACADAWNCSSTIQPASGQLAPRSGQRSMFRAAGVLCLRSTTQTLRVARRLTGGNRLRRRVAGVYCPLFVLEIVCSDTPAPVPPQPAPFGLAGLSPRAALLPRQSVFPVRLLIRDHGPEANGARCSGPTLGGANAGATPQSGKIVAPALAPGCKPSSWA
jgi:hypothetical protein